MLYEPCNNPLSLSCIYSKISVFTFTTDYNDKQIYFLLLFVHNS